MFSLNKFDLDKLNSMTKYPGILTYHEIGDKGILQDKLSVTSFRDYECVIVTEKVDGTNARIILFNKDYMIGTREDIIFAKGDRIINPTLGIVNTLKSFADRLSSDLPEDDCIYVVFSEVYGGNVTAASKQYTSTKQWCFRLFDICRIESKEISNLTAMEKDRISQWRENGGQCYFTEEMINDFVDKYSIQRVPYLETLNGNDLPVNLAGTFVYLKQFEKSMAGIDFTDGRAEGIVVRTPDRKLIRKIRFEDYERTQRKGGF